MAPHIPKPCYGSIDVIAAIRRAKSPVSVAARFADSMITTDQTHERHFPEGGQALHTAIDVLVATDPSFPAEFRTKRNAWEIFTNQELFSGMLGIMLNSEHIFVRDQANAYLDVAADDREMKGIKSTMRMQCSRTYSEPALMDTLCLDVSDFSKINDIPTTVYICIPGDLIDVHYRYVRLLLSYFVSEIERGGLRRFQ
jgi:type IV secretory pathway TraG/TraD family ATPase VirD4